MSRAESIIKTFDKLCAEARTAEHRYDTLRILVEDWETVSSYISEGSTERLRLVQALGDAAMALWDAQEEIADIKIARKTRDAASAAEIAWERGRERAGTGLPGYAPQEAAK